MDKGPLECGNRGGLKTEESALTGNEKGREKGKEGSFERRESAGVLGRKQKTLKIQLDRCPGGTFPVMYREKKKGLLRGERR